MLPSFGKWPRWGQWGQQQQPMMPSFGQENAFQSPFTYGPKPEHGMRVGKDEYDQMRSDWRADRPMWSQDMALNMWRDQMNAWRMNKPSRFLQP